MPAAPSSGVERLSTSAATCAKTTSTARRNPARSRDRANNSSRDMPATSAPSRAHTVSAAVRMGAVINVMKTVNHHPPVSYTHLRAHETDSYLVCRLLLEK